MASSGLAAADGSSAHAATIRQTAAPTCSSPKRCAVTPSTSGTAPSSLTSVYASGDALSSRPPQQSVAAVSTTLGEGGGAGSGVAADGTARKGGGDVTGVVWAAIEGCEDFSVADDAGALAPRRAMVEGDPPPAWQAANRGDMYRRRPAVVDGVPGCARAGGDAGGDDEGGSGGSGGVAVGVARWSGDGVAGTGAGRGRGAFARSDHACAACARQPCSK